MTDVELPGEGTVVLDPAPMTLRSAAGPDAGGCPARGVLVFAFREDEDDHRPYWLLLCDEGEVPRVVLRARRR